MESRDHHRKKRKAAESGLSHDSNPSTPKRVNSPDDLVNDNLGFITRQSLNVVHETVLRMDGSPLLIYQHLQSLHSTPLSFTDFFNNNHAELGGLSGCNFVSLLKDLREEDANELFGENYFGYISKETLKILCNKMWSEQSYLSPTSENPALPFLVLTSDEGVPSEQGTSLENQLDYAELYAELESYKSNATSMSQAMTEQTEKLQQSELQAQESKDQMLQAEQRYAKLKEETDKKLADLQLAYQQIHTQLREKAEQLEEQLDHENIQGKLNTDSLEQSEVKIKQLEDELAHEKEQREKVERSIRRFKRDQDKLLTEKTDALRDAKSQNSKLEKEISDLRLMNQKFRGIRKRQDDQNNYLEKLKKELALEKLNKNDYKKHNEKLITRAKENEEGLKEATTKIAKHAEIIQSLRNERDEARKRTDELQADLKASHLDIEKIQVDTQKEIQLFKIKLEDASQTEEVLLKQNQELMDKFDLAKSTITDLKARLESVQHNALQAKEEFDKQNQNLKDELEKTSSTISSFTAQLENEKSDALQAREEFAKQSHHLKNELQTSISTIADLTAQLEHEKKNALQIREEFDKQLHDRKADSNSDEKMMTDISSHSEMEELNKQNQDLKDSLEAANKLIADLTARLEHEIKKSSASQQAHQLKERYIKETKSFYTEKCNNLEEECKSLKMDLEKNNTLSNLQSTFVELIQEENEALKAEVDELKKSKQKGKEKEKPQASSNYSLHGLFAHQTVVPTPTNTTQNRLNL